MDIKGSESKGSGAGAGVSPHVSQGGTIVTPGSTVEQRLAWLEAQNATLSAQNAALKAAKPQGKITLKIGEKKGLSVYGLGRFPVTLYKSQWLRLLGEFETIKAFIQAHDGELAERE